MTDRLKDALIKGYEASVPKLAEIMPGKTLVVLDCSGSMTTNCNICGRTSKRSSCIDKAALIAATIAKSTNGDIICFGSDANWYDGDMNENVFDIASKLRKADRGGTNFSSVFNLIHKERKAYDRIIILSDNMCNYGITRTVYKKYVHDVCDPYIYCVDLAGYGTTQLKSAKVANYFGYGYAMFDDIANKEFDPVKAINDVKKYVI